MQFWEKALDKFLTDWKNRKEVIGALVTGSYVTGLATEFSDIDVHIILSDDIRWRERGNKIVDGFLIEYFANPICQIVKNSKSEDGKNRIASDVRMFAIGKILFDKTGVLKRTKRRFEKQLKQKKIKKLTALQTEIKKYSLWDQLDNLKDLNRQNSPSFSFVYFNDLTKILEIYTEFIGTEICGLSKVHKMLTNEKFRKKYGIKNIPDQKFVSLFKKCLEKASLDKIEQLTDYVLKKMGGFKIDGWKIKSPPY
jgi:predicted nucleotidyltransferase